MLKATEAAWGPLEGWVTLNVAETPSVPKSDAGVNADVVKHHALSGESGSPIGDQVRAIQAGSTCWHSNERENQPQATTQENQTRSPVSVSGATRGVAGTFLRPLIPRLSSQAV